MVRVTVAVETAKSKAPFLASHAFTTRADANRYVSAWSRILDMDGDETCRIYMRVSHD